MTTPPIPRGYRLVRLLPGEITLPSGQVAYRRGLTFSIRRGAGSGEGPSTYVLPSGQRATRTSRGTYRVSRTPEVNPRRVHYDPGTRRYYESPSHPEQALRNPERYGTYINRQVQRDPEWLENRLDRQDRHGSRLSNRLAKQEVAAPGQHQQLIQRQRASGDIQTVSVLVADQGTVQLALTAIERSIVAQHWNEVHKYITGQESKLWRFRGIRVGAEGYTLMTDEFEIDEAGNRGELDFESMYPVTYPVSFGSYGSYAA